MNSTGGWGKYEGWATSAENALERYISGNDASGGVRGYNYATKDFSASFVTKSYGGNNYIFSGTRQEEYFYAGYGNAFDASAIASGFALHQQSMGGRILDAVHGSLDVLSFVPIIGTAAAGINAGIYLGEGDLKNAAISGAAMIPFGKIIAGGGKLLMGLGKVEQYALRATNSGFYPVMQRGFSKAQGLQYLEQGEVWKFGTTKNPFTRYTESYKNSIGEGVEYFREFKGLKSEAVQLQNMKIMNYLLQNGHLPPGNKIIN